MNYCRDHISRKFKVMSFCAAITVVCIHSDPYVLTINPGPVAKTIEIILPYFFLWAVPFFFLTSGFFFARHLSRNQSFSYGKFLKHKFVTLIIPYLFWGGIYGTIVGTPILIAVNKSHHDILLGRTVFESGSIISCFDRMFGLLHTAPANGALWFVRMLILFFLFAPLWRIILIHAKWLLLVAGITMAITFGVDGITTSVLFSVNGIPFEISWGAFGFLFWGMFLASINAENHRFRIGECALFLAAAIGMSFLSLPRYCWIICMVVFYWALYDVLPISLPHNLPTFFSLSFWIYCMHHHLTGYAGALLRAILGRGEISYCLQLILTPTSVILFAVLCAHCTRRYLPRLFFLLNGGR